MLLNQFKAFSINLNIQNVSGMTPNLENTYVRILDTLGYTQANMVNIHPDRHPVRMYDFLDV